MENHWPEIPGYRIEQELGRGGMATVYRAVQDSLQRQVAIKVMKAALAADEDFAERFVREARTAASLQHPGIVGIFDAGTVGHHSYIAMEYVPGEDLKARLREGALEEPAALAIARQIAEALDYAHSEGFVHRDVKPENILFRKNGQAVLTDFGIARAIGSGTRMTGTGMSIGTPHYMSPEQARGRDVDGRSDLYALGVLFYEMLTGRVPFDAQDSFAVGMMHINEAPPELPEHLARYQPVLDRLLAKEPDDRFQSGQALIQALAEAEAAPSPAPSRRAATRVVEAQASGAGQASRSTSPPTRSRSGLFWGLGGAALAGVLGVGLYLWQASGPSPMPVGGSSSLGRSMPASPPASTNEPRTRQPDPVASPSGTISEANLVRTVQDYLNRLGYQVPMSGEMDARTEAGIRAFEQERGLLVTGSIDEVLKANLSDAYAEIDRQAWDVARRADTEQAYRDYAEAHPQGQSIGQVQSRITAVRERMAAEAKAAARQRELVSSIQRELNRLGRPMTVDGSFGPATAEAIRAFERASERPQRGEATEALLARLKQRDRWPAPQPGDVFRDCPDCPEMVVIPAGSFMMGSPSSEPQRDSDEGPQHRVTLESFALARTEVTFEQWQACVADGGCSHRPEDRGWGRGNRPVINVSWNDAQEYVAWLSRETGEGYRLPSESEWEYAARADTTTRFHTGNCITTDQANFEGDRPAQGCPSGRDRKRTVAVGSFAPNAFGLYDMHGNVWEWVQDCWNDSYRGSPVDGSAWMRGDCGHAVLRGGSWYFSGHSVRSAIRFNSTRGGRNINIGFRVARSVTL